MGEVRKIYGKNLLGAHFTCEVHALWTQLWSLY